MNGRSDLEDSDEEDVVRKTLQQLEEAHASDDGLGEEDAVDEDLNEEGGANNGGEEEEQEKNGEVRYSCLALEVQRCAFWVCKSPTDCT